MYTVAELSKKLMVNEDLSKELLKVCKELKAEDVDFKKIKVEENRYKIHIINAINRKKLYTFKYKMIKFNTEGLF